MHVRELPDSKVVLIEFENVNEEVLMILYDLDRQTSSICRIMTEVETHVGIERHLRHVLGDGCLVQPATKALYILVTPMHSPSSITKSHEKYST